MFNKKMGKKKVQFKKKDPVAKAKQSLQRSKGTSLMVNPVQSDRRPIPQQFRTKLYLTYTAKESVGATANNYFDILMNGLSFPLSTGASPPGLRINGDAASVTTTSPLAFKDIVGDNGNSGLYGRYCVLNCKYKITYFPLGLTDTQYVICTPLRDGIALSTSVNVLDEYPYSRGPVFMVGYNSQRENTITGTVNLAKYLGYSSDSDYSLQDNSCAGRATNPVSGIGTALTNLVFLRVSRASANGTTLSSPLPYKIDLEWDVLFTRIAPVLTE